MPEKLGFGVHLDDLIQEDLDEIVAIFVRTINTRLYLTELLGEHPLKIDNVREDILKHGFLERRWDGTNDFRIQANPFTTNNPLIGFSFEPYLRDNPRAEDLIKQAKMFDITVSSHLLERGIAVEVNRKNIE